MIDRIKSLLAVKNLTSSQFANEIGVQRSGISHILSGRNKPSLDFILKILEHYPDLNEVWLLKGEGEMYKQASQKALFSSTKEEMSIIEQEEGLNKKDEPSKDDIISGEVDQPKSPEVQIDKSDSFEEKLIQDQVFNSKSDKIIKIITVYEDHSFEIFRPRK